MDTLIRITRVSVLLVLAAVVVSLVIGVARPETGVVEKVLLVALIGACVYVAAKVTDWTTRLRERVSSH